MTPQGPREPAPGAARRAPARGRAAAAVLDGGVVALVCLFLPQPFPPVLVLVVLAAYQGLTTWWLHASLGKALLGLRVVRIQGEVTVGWSLLRAGPGYAVLTVAGLGWLAIALPPDHRPLHDRVLGGDVVVVDDRRLSPGRALARFVSWADARTEEQQRRRRRSWAALAGLWAWLGGLGEALQRGEAWLRGDRMPTDSSVASVLSRRTAGWLGGFAVATTAVVVAPVPPVERAGEWLVTPRYWLGGEPATATGEGATSEVLTGPWQIDADNGWNEERLHGMVVELRSTAGDPATAWDVVLRSAPEGCAHRVGEVVAVVRRVDAVDGREVVPDSRLQVSDADSFCSGMVDTQPSFADLSLTPAYALYLGDDGTLRARLGFHDATVFRKEGP